MALARAPSLQQDDLWGRHLCVTAWQARSKLGPTVHATAKQLTKPTSNYQMRIQGLQPELRSLARNRAVHGVCVGLRLVVTVGAVLLGVGGQHDTYGGGQ